jgi:RNase P subunit RPR2
MALAETTCEHCEGILLSNKAYRVWTEDAGRILLDMVVCYACNLEAQKLGLNTDEIKRIARPSQK